MNDSSLWMTALERLFRLQKYEPLARGAEAFAWGRDPIQMVKGRSAAVSSDAIVTVDQLPAPCGWWSFEEPLITTGNGHTFDGLLYSLTDHGTYVTFIPVSYARQLGTFRHWRIGLGQKCSAMQLAGKVVGPSEPSAQDHATYFVYMQFFIAACAWLKSRTARISDGHVERHARKRLARDYAADVPSSVKVIQLRHLEPESHTPSDSPRSVKWKNRWPVVGHPRNQPYKDGSKVIWIDYHFKGPPDKPLRMPAHTVYAVTR